MGAEEVRQRPIQGSGIVKRTGYAVDTTWVPGVCSDLLFVHYLHILLGDWL